MTKMKKNLNQDGNTDSIVEVTEDEASYNDLDFYNGDQEDDQQSDYNSAGDLGNDPIGGPKIMTLIDQMIIMT